MTKKVIMLGVVVLSVLSLCAYGFAATSGQGAIELDSTGIEAAAYIDGGNTGALPTQVLAWVLKGC
jgi:hypothetical protein